MQQVFRYVDQMTERYIRELSEFCAHRSVKGDGNGLMHARMQLKEKLALLGFAANEYAGPQEPAVLYGCRRMSGKKTVLFYNHYDVAPEGPKPAWATPPFQLTEKDGRLWGRGVSDNKGALLARLQAIEAILAVKGELPAGVAYVFDGDEETGSAALKRMAKEEPELLKQMADADLCIWENGRTLPDGSPEAAFGVRSTLTVHLKVRSSNGDEHSRMGAELPNASWRMVWALASLKDINEQVLIEGFYDDVLPDSDADLDVLSKYPYDEEGMLARKDIKEFLLGLRGIKLKKKIFLQPSLNINGMESGEPWKGLRNIIPYSASARISIVLVPQQHPEDILNKLRRHLCAKGFDDVEVSADPTGFPVRTPVDHPWRDVLGSAASAVYEKPLTASITQLGSGPAYLLRTVRPDLPIICACGVAALDSGHHSAKENIVIENYIKGIKYTIAALYEAGKLPQSVPL